MPCIDPTIVVSAIPVLATLDAKQAIDAINASSAAGVALEPTGASATIAAVADWLLAVSWQLLPLAAIVIILDLALRRAGPVVRSALWWMVLAKLIVPPGLGSPLSIAHLWPTTATLGAGIGDSETAGVSSASTAAMAAAGAASASESTAASAVIVASAESADAPSANSAGGHAQRGATAAAAGALTRMLPSMLLTMWAIGVMAAGSVACWRYRRVRAACLQDASPLGEVAPDVYDTVAVGAARRLGLAALPPIVVASQASHSARGVGLPAVIGFFSPCIVLPRTLLDRPRVEIEHVLLHELAHVRRRDPLASLVCLVAQIVFWFHPAIWCARRRLATLREMACDRTVARLLGDATPAYRRTLILLARTAALGVPQSASASPSASASAFASASGILTDGPGALGLFQRQSQLVTRLDALARPVSMRRATECAACAAIALAILVSCVPLASPRAAPAASIDVPPLDQLPGSLQKRYAVMRALALEEQARSQPPSR